MIDSLQRPLAELETFSTENTLPMPVAGLCVVHESHYNSVLVVSMPMHILPSEIGCPPRRFERGPKTRNMPAGPYLSEHQSHPSGSTEANDTRAFTNLEEHETLASGPSE
jgi:hypothetical protein